MTEEHKSIIAAALDRPHVLSDSQIETLARLTESLQAELEQAQRERDALRESLLQIGNRIGKPTGSWSKEHQHLDMEETLQVISKMVQETLAALEKQS